MGVGSADAPLKSADARDLAITNTLAKSRQFGRELRVELVVVHQYRGVAAETYGAGDGELVDMNEVVAALRERRLYSRVQAMGVE